MQPLPGPLLPHHDAHGGHERLEGAVGGSPTDPALPLGIGQLEDAHGQLFLSDVFGAVDQHPGATGHADPEALGAAEPSSDLAEDHVRELLEQALSGEGSESAGVLSEEDVGRTEVALFKDYGSQRGGASVAHLNVDPRGLLESFNDGADERFVPAGVHRECLSDSAAESKRRDQNEEQGSQ